MIRDTWSKRIVRTARERTVCWRDLSDDEVREQLRQLLIERYCGSISNAPRLREAEAWAEATLHAHGLGGSVRLVPSQRRCSDCTLGSVPNYSELLLEVEVQR